MHPRATSYVLFRITNVPFPVTGEYFVELYCEHSFVDDQVLTVIESGGES